MNYAELLSPQFNNHIGYREKRPGITQLFLPLFYEDGDMVDIFLEKSPVDNSIRICDHGMALMRLSYSFDLNTDRKEEIFQKIITENQVFENNGNLYMDTQPQGLCPAVLQFAQTIAKVSSMQLYKREVIQNLFYEMLDEFISESLIEYHPNKNVCPIESREDLEVDYEFSLPSKHVYLFGVKDSAKARLATISCLEFQRNKIPFKSFVVHEDFDGLNKKDRIRITSAADKQFISLDDFRDNARQVFEREVA